VSEDASANSASFGARIQTRRNPKAKDWPDWFNPNQRDQWAKKGLILWERESQVVALLSATQALQLLDQLGSEDAGKESAPVRQLLLAATPTGALKLDDHPFLPLISTA
jgi:hypothetical protein